MSVCNRKRREHACFRTALCLAAHSLPCQKKKKKTPGGSFIEVLRTRRHVNMLIMINAWGHVNFWLVIRNLGIAYLSSNQRWKGFFVPVPVVKMGNSLTGSPLSPTDTHRSWSWDEESWTTRKLCVNEQLFNSHFAVMLKSLRIKISWRIMYHCGPNQLSTHLKKQYNNHWIQGNAHFVGKHSYKRKSVHTKVRWQKKSKYRWLL